MELKTDEVLDQVIEEVSDTANPFAVCGCESVALLGIGDA